MTEIIKKKGNTSWPLSGPVSSRRTELGRQRKATTNDWKVLLFVIMFIMLDPAPFSSLSPLSDSELGHRQTLTVKEIGPPVPPPPPLHSHTVSLCFTNWSHSESTGRKTKRDIPPFFPTSPWPHTRSAHMCVMCVCSSLSLSLLNSVIYPQTSDLVLISTIGVFGRVYTAPSSLFLPLSPPSWRFSSTLLLNWFSILTSLFLLILLLNKITLLINMAFFVAEQRSVKAKLLWLLPGPH